MTHLGKVSQPKHVAVPALAGQEQVCGRHVLTGEIKCVDRDSKQANKLEDVPVP